MAYLHKYQVPDLCRCMWGLYWRCMLADITGVLGSDHGVEGVHNKPPTKQNQLHNTNNYKIQTSTNYNHWSAQGSDVQLMEAMLMKCVELSSNIQTNQMIIQVNKCLIIKWSRCLKMFYVMLMISSDDPKSIKYSTNLISFHTISIVSAESRFTNCGTRRLTVRARM